MTTSLRTILLMALVAGSAQGAPVDCSNPDNLCTGDPCVIPNLEPEAPCIVDFGSRAVVIQGLHNVQGVDFTAGSFDIEGTISGGIGAGGFLHLESTGQIFVDGLISLSGAQTSGLSGSSTVELRSTGANIHYNAPIRVMDGGAGDQLLLDAVNIFSDGGGILNAEGAAAVTLRAGFDIELRSPIKSRLQNGLPGLAAPLLLEAGSEVELFEPVSMADGAVTITTTGRILVRAAMRTRGPAITLDGGNGVRLFAPIRSVGTGSISTSCDGITISGGASVVTADYRIQCAGTASSGGVTITADSYIELEAVSSTSRGTAGDITITSNTGGVVVRGLLDAHGGSAGGDVLVTGSGPFLSGESLVLDVPRVDTRYTQPTGTAGVQRYTAVGGDLSLARAFVAQDGGTIEASASGNLTADGTFRVGAGGCIALSAGGTLDTGSSSFDQPVVADCP
jgi:hypothetical protein